MASKKQGSAVAPPSLNVYKKVAVLCTDKDSLTYEDAEGKQKSVTIEELGHDAIATAVRDSRRMSGSLLSLCLYLLTFCLILSTDSSSYTETQIRYPGASY
jgi:hypothetical protein